MSSISYVFCKYFLPLRGLSSHVLDSAFHKADIFNFNEVELINVFFHGGCLWCCSPTFICTISFLYSYWSHPLQFGLYFQEFQCELLLWKGTSLVGFKCSQGPDYSNTFNFVAAPLTVLAAILSLTFRSILLVVFKLSHKPIRLLVAFPLSPCFLTHTQMLIMCGSYNCQEFVSACSSFGACLDRLALSFVIDVVCQVLSLLF